MWLEHEGKRRTIGLHEGSTIEVEAYVCLWPHVTTVGSAGLLHIIVKHNLDINLYGSPLVQVRLPPRLALVHVCLEACARSVSSIWWYRTIVNASICPVPFGVKNIELSPQSHQTISNEAQNRVLRPVPGTKKYRTKHEIHLLSPVPFPLHVPIMGAPQIDTHVLGPCMRH